MSIVRLAEEAGRGLDNKNARLVASARIKASHGGNKIASRNMQFAFLSIFFALGALFSVQAAIVERQTGVRSCNCAGEWDTHRYCASAALSHGSVIQEGVSLQRT